MESTTFDQTGNVQQSTGSHEDVGHDVAKKEDTLAMKTTKIKNRLKSAENIKSVVGLRNLRNNSQDLLDELMDAKAEQEALAKSGDELDQLASQEAIAKLDEKIKAINDGIGTLSNLAKTLPERLKKQKK